MLHAMHSPSGPAITISNISSHLLHVSSATNQTQTLYYSMMDRYQELEDRVENATQQLQPIPGIVQKTENDTDAANSSIILAEKSITERLEIINNITKHKNLSDAELISAKSSYMSLRDQLQSAREAAASVSGLFQIGVQSCT